VTCEDLNLAALVQGVAVVAISRLIAGSDLVRPTMVRGAASGGVGGVTARHGYGHQGHQGQITDVGNPRVTTLIELG
jgi:hypothetical protein